MKDEANKHDLEISASFPFSTASGGFTELLQIPGYYCPDLLLELPPPGRLPPESSEPLNLPATPNESSFSSSCSEQAMTAPPDPDADDNDADKQKKEPLMKKKNKGQERKREPRYAFLTRSDVDHLDDGYRWRKYGQKAVKNSPYPRSYYRCTTVTCGVKKRVERSCEDPTVVVTTYEGQHTHHSPGTRGRHMMGQRPLIEDQLGVPQVQFNRQLHSLHLPFMGSYLPPAPEPHPLDPRHVASREHPMPGAASGRDNGLLQDIFSSNVNMKTEG